MNDTRKALGCNRQSSIVNRQSNRRSFLKTVAAIPILAPYVSRLPRPSAAARRFDPNFGPAHEALRALSEGVISSKELLETTYSRIKQYNPGLNAFLTLMEEQARERGRLADQDRAAGKIWGPLHGLPIVIKDAFETAGVRTTSGSKMLEKHVPKEDAAAVARLKKAGAIVVGKTNMPEFAGDLQSYNEIAGTANNPWDTQRTPGGSTGGGAACIAAGIGFLELGSDIGGSIRTPSHFCGIYGHKPTLNVVPMDGHIPPPPGTEPTTPDLPVAGPMARSARDLALQLEVMAGPVSKDSIAYQWNLPSARGSRLKDYRIGYVLDDPFCPVGSDVLEVLSGAIEALRKTGLELVQGWPKGFNPQDGFETYVRLLAAVVGRGMGEEQLGIIQQGIGKPWGNYARAWLDGMKLTHKQWLGLTEQRLKSRVTWEEYFKTCDAFLMPENIVPAFPHNQKLTFFERKVSTPEGDRLYADMLKWISPATLSGCPATVAPVGRTKANLPVGIQIMGPYLEDATSIDIAGRVTEIVGGFEPPPGY